MSVARQLLAEASLFGASIYLDGDRVRVTAPEPLPVEMMAQLREHKSKIRTILEKATVFDPEAPQTAPEPV